MEHVVGVIDMDGFTVNGRFLCKELGLKAIGGGASSCLFDHGIALRELSARDKRTAWFVEQHVHHLPFEVPAGVEFLPINRLEPIVTRFFIQHRINNLSTIAYKGGTVERDLLRELNIPSIDLEKFGCPPASMLLDELVWLETCGHHLKPISFNHCPLVEVQVFASWLEDRR